MSEIYIVRLTQGFRAPGNPWSRPRRTTPRIVRAFPTLEKAQRFTAETLPLWQNPFDQRSMYVFQEENGRDILSL